MLTSHNENIKKQNKEIENISNPEKENKAKKLKMDEYGFPITN